MKFNAILMVSIAILIAADAKAEVTTKEENIARIQSWCIAENEITLNRPEFSVVPAHAKASFPYLEVKSNITSNFVRIYYDKELAAAAKSKAGCLIGLLDLLAPIIPDVRHNIHWSAMVLTTNSKYTQPRTKGELRWPNVLTNGKWDDKSLFFLIHAMPHEEVHLSQARSKTALPRWFLEGHAEWAAMHVTQQVRPDFAKQRRQELGDAFSQLKAAHLAEWGGIKVKQEAIDRQLTPEDRVQLAKNPNYSPAGPFTFGPGDYADDNENEQGRYGAALALFDHLEERHGLNLVQTWITKVLACGDANQVAILAEEILGENIKKYLE